MNIASESTIKYNMGDIVISSSKLRAYSLSGNVDIGDVLIVLEYAGESVFDKGKIYKCLNGSRIIYIHERQFEETF